MDLPITISHELIRSFKRRLQTDGPWDSWERMQLSHQVALHTLINDFDQLQSLKYLSKVEPLPHQVEAAYRVVHEMNGRAILADEVGLGKTIEAALVMKEYLIRGLAKKILILTPSSLVTQWTAELNQKFDIPAVAQKKAYMWKQYDILVASLDTAKREPHRSHVLEQEYDLIIIDEAHKLKNKKTNNWQFANQLKKKYCLLLTATPIQNELHEIYNLVTLLKPGHLGGERSFQAQYKDGKRKAKNASILQHEVGKVMIRNRRKEEQHNAVQRIVTNIPCQFSPIEQAVYERLEDLLQHYRELTETQVPSLPLLILQREFCSSKEAAFSTLINYYNQAPASSTFRRELEQVAQELQQITMHAKAMKMVELVREMNDKVIIFTEYRATQNMLQKILYDHGIRSVPFRGGFRRNKKDWMRQLFENHAQVLIATEAGGEGINLQFCNQMINYDLPWNPMRVEQRIGRIHRVGQTRDVQIYNLYMENTVEEEILQLLYEKILLFESVIGQLDDILERLKLDHSLEEEIEAIFHQSDQAGERRLKLFNLQEAIRVTSQLISNPQ